MRQLYRALYHALIAAGHPIGGIRPRRLYDALGRRAYPDPDSPSHWTRNRWKHELLLSHHFHLDRNILIHGDYDHELHLLFQSRVAPGMTVLDVGANLGEMALHLASLVGEHGTVHAFEPLPPAFERLVAHVHRNGLQGRIQTWQLALSNAGGELTMSVPAPDSDNQGIGSIVNHDTARMTGTVAIQATTLDAFVEKHAIAKIDFIKLDIQGAEYLFLEGARQTLRTHRPELVMEVSPGDLAGIQKTSQDLLSLVESMGYQIFNIHKGQPAARVLTADVGEKFAATNILCIPDHRAQVIVAK